MILAPNLAGFVHGFGLRDSEYPAGILLAKQIHSNIVLDRPGDGDALISNTALVGIKTADCVPVLLADPVTNSVAAIHAGWRGTVADIVGQAVRALGQRWQTRPEDIHAAIGPCIGPCCYEVGPEVARQFEIERIGKIHLDLPAENERRLRDAGVRNIWKSGECTFCTGDRFYSYRREREQAGRMISFVGIAS
jgi:YfiH family protein